MRPRAPFLVLSLGPLNAPFFVARTLDLFKKKTRACSFYFYCLLPLSILSFLPKRFKLITFPSLIQTGESATLNLLAHTLFESPLDFSARRAVTTGQHFSRVEKIARPLDDLVRVRFVKIQDFILPLRLTFCDSDS